MELGKLKEDLESNQPSCPTFHQFTVWSGISGGHWPPGTSKGTPGQNNVCTWEGKVINDFREIICHVYVYSGKINDYVWKIQYLNRSLFCTQPAQYFGGKIPLSIRLNKELLLLNATVVLSTFYLYWFLAPPAKCPSEEKPVCLRKTWICFFIMISLSYWCHSTSGCIIFL